MTTRRPGWQPGVSCPNGAGNHKYSEAEKEFMANDPARLEAKRKIAEGKALEKSTRKLERKKKLLLAKENQDITPNVIAQLSNIVEWDTKELTLTCVDGHEYTKTGQQLSRVKPFATICPVCANIKRGKPRANARLRYRMRADEQGFEVPPFKSLSNLVPMIHRTTKETIELRSFQIGNWRGAGRDRTVRFVADEDDHVFIWLGPKPEVEHPFIAQMLNTQETEEYDDYGGLGGLKLAISECIDAGDKVVNLSHNKTWLDVYAFNEYTWGSLPMTEDMIEYHLNYSSTT